MDTFEAILERRSVKHFDPEHRLSAEEIRRLMEATLLSPTSFNMQNWRFVVIEDTDAKEALCAAAFNQSQVKDASAVIVLCADLHAHAGGERYWANAPEPVREMIVPMITQFYSENSGLQRDEAMRSIGIAAQTLMLAAKAMGYDSCPMIGFDPKKVGEIIRLPDHHVVGLLLPIGKAIKPANARAGQLPYEEVVFSNGFPQT